MRFLFIVLFFVFQVNINIFGQNPGFKNLYAGETTGATFVDILWDGEKLVTTGQFLTDTASHGALNGLLYMELDTNGNSLHTDIYFEPNDGISSSIGNSVAQTSNGKIFVMTQPLESTDALLCIYQNGARISSIHYQFPALNTTLRYLKDADDQIFLSGHFQNLDYTLEGFLIKADQNGNKIWAKYYGTPGIQTNFVEPFIIDNNTILIPGGQTNWDPSGSILNTWTKSYILSVDSTGTKKSEWVSPENVENGIATRLQRLANGNWLYATYEFIPLPGQINDWGAKPKLVCRDSNFNLVWERYLSDFVSKTNRISDINPTPDGNYVVVGRWDYYNYNVIHKFKSDGTPVWTYYDACSTLGCDENLGGVTVLPSGSVFIAGDLTNYEIPKSFGLIIKLDQNGCLDSLTCGPTIGTEEHNLVNKIKVYPNPTTGLVYINKPIGNTVALFNILGQEIKEEEIVSSKHTLDLSSLDPGVYLIKMHNKKLH
ncbi:MAG: T9SS type A sorting domain-containing protein, partial [Bacteroidota bacterium]